MLKNKANIEMGAGLLIHMTEQMMLHFPNETGGVLMGCCFGSLVKVTHVVGPGPRAVHKPTTFKPDNDFHEQQIAKIYRATGGACTYVGDWHTHPKSHAYLSNLDKAVLRRIAQYGPSRLPEPVMIIMGTSPFEVNGWYYKKHFVAKEFLPLPISIQRDA